MTKNPRDERQWTNVDLQGDPDGYKAARAAREADKEKARKEAIYQDDLRSFTKAFVASGGEAQEAGRMFKTRRNEQAAEAASRDEQSAEQTAFEHSRREAMRRV